MLGGCGTGLAAIEALDAEELQTDRVCCRCATTLPPRALPKTGLGQDGAKTGPRRGQDGASAWIRSALPTDLPATAALPLEAMPPGAVISCSDQGGCKGSCQGNCPGELPRGTARGAGKGLRRRVWQPIR